MGTTPPVTPEDESLKGVQYTELDKEEQTVGVLYDPGNSEAWLQSTVTVPLEN